MLPSSRDCSPSLHTGGLLRNPPKGERRQSENPVKDASLSRQLLSLQKKDAPGHLERKQYAFAALKRTKDVQ
ncbi:MAG: hypothetical protein HY438_00110 [DPANN group archaeon]|nr:hypothetical protein [DPANN group archaeon]